MNEKHVTTLALGNLDRGSRATKTSYGLVDIAIFVFAAAAIASFHCDLRVCLNDAI